MAIKLLFFGRLREQAGKAEDTRALPGHITDTLSLRRWADRTYALDGALLPDTIRVAVNAQIIASNGPVSDGDEIAFLPPVSGG